MCFLPWKSFAIRGNFFPKLIRSIANSKTIAEEKICRESAMRKIVPVHRKKEIISKNILERKDIMREKGKTLSERRNGSFLGRSSLKAKLRKSALSAGDQAILLKIVRKRRKQQSSLNKPRFMQRTFLSWI